MKHPHEDPVWVARRSKMKQRIADPDIERLEKEKRILVLKKEILQLEKELKEADRAE
jgi:hypothetical protein